MNKCLKTSLVILLFICIFITSKCFAVNIDMSLSSNLVDTDTNSAISNESSTNTNSENPILGTNATDNVLSENSTSESTSATFSNVNSLPESELGLTNILNILLITVGVVLILLAIAILIRLKK